jgi:hypothetical protein
MLWPHTRKLSRLYHVHSDQTWASEHVIRTSSPKVAGRGLIHKIFSVVLRTFRLTGLPQIVGTMTPCLFPREIVGSSSYLSTSVPQTTPGSSSVLQSLAFNEKLFSTASTPLLATSSSWLGKPVLHPMAPMIAPSLTIGIPPAMVMKRPPLL